MSTYTQIFYHIVFSTKDRQKTLVESGREELYRYILGIVKNKQGHLYRINAMEDHLHLFCDLHPTVCLADLIKSIKGASWHWIRESGVFPEFLQWQQGYGAFTHSEAEKARIIAYIKDQQDHHRQVTFKDELRTLLTDAGVEFEEKYLS
ncbi:MAG: IS200/IS605 family transposase [bacterium]|nr:IS200/IS605 family transposase [bacterium]